MPLQPTESPHGTWEKVPQNVTWWDKILPAADSPRIAANHFSVAPPRAVSSGNRSLPVAEVAFPSTYQDGVSLRLYREITIKDPL